MHKEASAIDGVRQSLRQHWTRLEARYQIVFACFLATFTTYVERVGFPLAFTAVAKDAGIGEGKKGTVMSAFFWGYALSQASSEAIGSCAFLKYCTESPCSSYELTAINRATGRDDAQAR